MTGRGDPDWIERTTAAAIGRGAPTGGRWRLGVAVALGCAAALSGFVFGMPGDGEFVLAMWLAGFVALIDSPGWSGFLALLVGATASAAALDVSDGVFGLLLLVVAIVVALAGHGALSAAILVRMRELGWRQGLSDPSVRRGGALALGSVMLFAWIAADLARNPP